MGHDNKSILFLTLSFVCIWVILDSIFGKKHLHNFLSNVFPFYTTEGMFTEVKSVSDVVEVPSLKQAYSELKQDPEKKNQTWNNLLNSPKIIGTKFWDYYVKGKQTQG